MVGLMGKVDVCVWELKERERKGKRWIYAHAKLIKRVGSMRLCSYSRRDERDICASRTRGPQK